MKKRKQPRKVKPPKQTTPLPSIEVPPLHISFPLTLFHKAENKFCYFKDEPHMMKYIERCKLTPKDVKITKTKPRKNEDGLES